RMIRLIILLAGCTEFPALDGTIPPQAEAADFPELVPLAPLLATRRNLGTDAQATTRSLEARIANLQARARALQGRPVLDSNTRARLRGAIG
ncbi:MAG: hypothetical protein AAFY39_06780, partial [Pseudomonadota bacterium]